MKDRCNTRDAIAKLCSATGSDSGFLPAEKISIGSWWQIAQLGEYGYCVLNVDVKRREATVLSTSGELRTIDTFKLQYRYSRVFPNDKKLVGARNA